MKVMAWCLTGDIHVRVTRVMGSIVYHMYPKFCWQVTRADSIEPQGPMSATLEGQEPSGKSLLHVQEASSFIKA